MKTHSLIVAIKDGKLATQAMRDSMIMMLSRFEGKTLELVFRSVKKKRTLPQNAYYWGVVIPCVLQVLESYGNDTDAEMGHEVMKEMFVPQSGRKTVALHAGQIKTYCSTSDVGTMVLRCI